MIANYKDEEWKKLSMPDFEFKGEFKVSNYGRVIRKMPRKEKEELYTARPVNGYEVINLLAKEGNKKKTVYLHKIVASLFLEKSKDKMFVTHLDYDKKNNHIDNLKWVNRKELVDHQEKNPLVIKGKEKRKINKPYAKLNEAKVKLLKRKIFDPNRRTRLRIIAKQFGISEMQLYRIKSGENWGDVTDY